MARYGGPDDGRTAHEREIHQHLSRRPPLVSSIRFEFATANRVLFGPGVLRQFQPNHFGQRALVVAGRSASRVAPLLEILKSAGVASTHYPITEEPTLDLVSRGVEEARKTES